MISWIPDTDAANAVVANATDGFIVKKQTMTSGPYLGIEYGQSNYCCELQVNDPTKLCSVKQYYTVPGAGLLYYLKMEYRHTVFGAESEVLLFRTSDMWSWDDSIPAWSPVQAPITMPNSMVRTSDTYIISNDADTVAGDTLLLVIRNKAGSPATSIMLYFVNLVEHT
jgi:hypothetical protein